MGFQMLPSSTNFPYSGYSCMKEMWNERYSVSDYVYGKHPNAFFREQLDLLDPGTILLPGEGEGRNAVYAAMNQWKVDAFDFSKSGYEKATRLAEEMGVAIEYKLSTYNDYTYMPSAYNACGLIFCHLPDHARSAFHEKVIQSLAPGGVLILEAFHSSQLGRDTGGPQNPEFLFNEQKLRSDFRTLDLTLCEEIVFPLYEGLYHTGEAHIIRCVGVKQ